MSHSQSVALSTPEEHVPFVDLARQISSIREEIHEAVEQIVDACAFSSGPAVEEFEAEFATYCSVRHCIGVNSGTSALHLALLAAGVRPGDEVITVPMTFVATAWAVSYLGARPVFVDIDPETHIMDVGLVERAITARTRAILPVHLYGQMADMDPLVDICERHGLVLIEDAAQAHGAQYRGRRAGAVGRIGCFSFYPGKNLGACGEGGAVTTDDDAIAARIRALRDHAQSVRHQHQELGFNYRMDGIQAAVLSVKLPYLDDWNAGRQKAAARYRALLERMPLTLPHEAVGRSHVWHLYVVRHAERDVLRAVLAEAGIATGVHYPTPVHLQPAYAELDYGPGDFPVAERLARECLSLPIYAELTAKQQLHVVQILEKAVQR